eukprot:Sdes_comp17879_c0_seq2m7142
MYIVSANFSSKSGPIECILCLDGLKLRQFQRTCRGNKNHCHQDFQCCQCFFLGRFATLFEDVFEYNGNIQQYETSHKCTLPILLACICSVPESMIDCTKDWQSLSFPMVQSKSLDSQETASSASVCDGNL